MIRVKLECWWTDSKNLNNRIIKQFVDDDDLNLYQFVENNPDYTIVFGNTDWSKLQTNKEKTFYFSQEPLWSPNQPKFDIDKYCSKIFISDKREYPDKPEYIECLLPMFYAGHGESDTREEFDWSLSLKERTNQKTKKMSMIVRKDHYSHFNHLENPLTNKIIYKDRTELGVILSHDERIDIYGLYWQNNGKNIKGEVWNKHIAIDNYKFSVACENTIQKNYISEKFWDLILNDTVPIYLGCSNVKDLLPDKTYIPLNNLTQNEMVEKISDILNTEDSLYDEFLQNILNLKKEFFVNPKYNLWEKIKLTIQENNSIK